ncbi:MAG: cell wall-binding repeat-containing protein [Acidimicrobiales bacterium]
MRCGRTIGFFIAVGALSTPAVGVLSAVTARPVAAADGDGPSFLRVCSQEPRTVDNSSSCIGAVVDAIDQARAGEGVGPMVLPDTYPSLAPDAQLLTIINRERTDRGLVALVGTTSDLDAKAQSGADATADPPVSPPAYSNGRWQGTSTEAASLSQALGADYYWMYKDGWGGSPDATFNLDCTSASSSGCWNHRRAILVAFDSTMVLSMGAALNPGAARGYPSWTTLLMGTTGRPPNYSSRWSDISSEPAWSDPAPACGDGQTPSGKISRVAGADRDTTAIMASTNAYPQAGSAQAVVLASDANFPDALTGGPLAVAKHGPLLITPADRMSPAVAGEIQRVLAPGATVYVLGGPLAITPSVDAALHNDGYAVQRLAGDDRYQTAVAIADARGDPATAIEVTGLSFADALAAAPAATAINAALLLTNGAQQASATAAYLEQHSGSRYAVGGPASAADPGATAISGVDRYATALAVTKTLVNKATTLAFATALTFPDALAGGPVAASQGGALLLVPGCGPIPPDVGSYLSSVSQSVVGGWLFGGGIAVGDQVLGQIDRALTPH